MAIDVINASGVSVPLASQDGSLVGSKPEQIQIIGVGGVVGGVTTLNSATTPLFTAPRKGTYTPYGVVSVGTSPVPVLLANPSRLEGVISNFGTAAVWIGGSTVAVGNGILIPAGGGWSDITSTGEWFAVSATSSQVSRGEVA